MFFRAAKSIVKSLSCQNHIDEKNFKIALIGAGEISQILSKLLKNNTKLNALSLYDVAAVNKSLLNYNGMYNYFDNQSVKHANQVKKLVEALYHLPIAENVSTLNNSSEKIIPKECSRMRPYARISNEMDHNNWFLDLMYPLFHKNDVNLILQAKIPKKMYQSIERTKIINNSFSNVAREKNQVPPKSLSNYDRELSERSMRKFRNIPNIEICEKAEKSINYWMIPAMLLNNKSKLLCEIYRHIEFSFPLNFMNSKGKNNHEVVIASNSNSKMTTSDALNIIEVWIQQISFRIKSIFTEVHAKIRSYLLATLDPYCLENTLVSNESILVSDIIFSNKILFASKDCKSKSDIRKKIQEFCARQRKRSLRKKIDEDDICKKRERSCMSERKCQKEDKMYEEKEIDCSKRGKRTFKKQNVVSCERRKSSCDKNGRDCRKTRKVEPQADRCKQKKNDDTSRTKMDLCKRQDRMEQEQISYKQQEQDLCKKEKKEEKEEKEKKEEIKKPDCSEIKKVKPYEKKDCPTVKKAPGCPENEKK